MARRSEMDIRIAETDEEIRACFPAIVELRAHLVEDQFVEQVRQQQRAVYRLPYASHQAQVVAVEGFRFGESLAWGKYLYVDDLVTTSGGRSQGTGRGMIKWLTEQARQAGCKQLHLDSSVHRFAAHRFYARCGMNIGSHHFSLHLTD